MATCVVKTHKIPINVANRSAKWGQKGRKEGIYMSFVGQHKHSLDAKNRVFIPAKYREELGGEFYITRKFEPYLSVYTAAQWAEYVDVIASLPEADAAQLQDYILGAAQKCNPDSSGRIIIDDILLKHAKIQKSIVFVGSGKQIKIFAEEVWNEREDKRDPDTIRNIMLKYGL